MNDTPCSEHLPGASSISEYLLVKDLLSYPWETEWRLYEVRNNGEQGPEVYFLTVDIFNTFECTPSEGQPDTGSVTASVDFSDWQTWLTHPVYDLSSNEGAEGGDGTLSGRIETSLLRRFATISLPDFEWESDESIDPFWKWWQRGARWLKAKVDAGYIGPLQANEALASTFRKWFTLRTTYQICVNSGAYDGSETDPFKGLLAEVVALESLIIQNVLEGDYDDDDSSNRNRRGTQAVRHEPEDPTTRQHAALQQHDDHQYRDDGRVIVEEVIDDEEAVPVVAVDSLDSTNDYPVPE